ncbi:hypothetical protein ACFCXF_29185 [Streptomyces virginiae]|uniref:hypothetical protein n=1 Tax=Streptomyces TaxID=1883 RepID=UPI00225148E8|nr:hypothetical protein [Streptomyces virginiae]MCX4714961.1 hypothetical protein [Streptomyces virginiae]WTB23522.1 hypothetical protein OG253_19535 [Streptomyces virginiae]
MTQPTVPPAPACPDCDGFSAAKVTLGGRDRTGALRIITAHCPACHGTGKQFGVAA